MADLLERFRNAVLTEAVINRGAGVGLVDPFAKGVMFYLDRYLERPGVDASTAQALRDMAVRAVDRTRAAGRVEMSEIEAWISDGNMSHKFKVGSPSIKNSAALGTYKIVAKLPIEADDRLIYRIKSAAEAFERTAEESELTLP